MKKRWIALLLCAALLTALLYIPGTADNKLSFISINDTLPPELINTAVSYGGRVYVPYWLFANYGLGLSYVYFSSASTAYLYNADRQLFFELPSGKTYDGDDFRYSTPAILQGGTVYLPLDFVCSFFGGLRYSTIAENEYGSILRITTGAEVLSDAEFTRAAQNAMRHYYRDYNQTTETAAPTKTPERTPTPPSHDGDLVYLAMLGLPQDRLLEQLQQLKMEACFFLTAEEIGSDPDLVRRIACSGYGLGVYCPGGTQAEFDAGAALLLEAARIRTTLTVLPEDEPTPVGGARLLPDAAFMPEESRSAAAQAYGLTSALEAGSGNVTLALPCGEAYADAVTVVLYYLQSNGFSVAAPRLTDAEQS